MKPARFIALRLSREFHVLPSAILRAPVRDVIEMLNYTNFRADFEETANELNKPERE